MSYGGFPWWVYQMIFEYDVAKALCCFDDELNAGLSKEAAKHMYNLHGSVFHTHEPGGWNAQDYSLDYADIKQLRS